MFVCDRGCYYYVDVCLVLALLEVVGIGQVSLEAYYMPIVAWGYQSGSLPTYPISDIFNPPYLTLLS